MNRNKTIRAVLAQGTLVLMLLGVANPAQAAPVEWTLNNWAFSGGGSATGSFVYDADLDSFSNVNISSTLGPTSFTFVGLGAGANTLEFVTGDPSSDDLTGTPTVLASIGGGGMTNTPTGVLSVLTQGGTNPDSSQSACDNAACTVSSSPVFLTAGNISGSVVPVPAAVWLFGSALGLLGWLRRQVT